MLTEEAGLGNPLRQKKRACRNFNMNFWKDRWLNGMAPAKLATLLYRLARRKSISVADAISNGRWLRDLSRISNEEELHQFFQLWTKIDEVQMNDNPDAMKWLPCANGQYSAKSAYEIQFVGRIQQPHLEKVWSAKVEGKIKIFLWLLLRNRNWP
jgi:hypothetical protein